MWLAISRLHEKWLRFYHRRLFLARIGSREKTLRVAGRVNVFKPLPVHGRKPLVTIGKNVFLHPGVLFDGDGPVSIGDNVFIGKDVILYASAGGGITIGIGAGKETSGQVMVVHDAFDIPPGKKAKFVKNFMDGASSLHDAACRAVAAIKEGSYPGPEHTYAA